ncbi:hypothetical protein ACIBF7_07920 [Nonomuraea sp. NPDC050478]|uniref:Uncharacterized protein n=1 Tax=Nonomuraea harbinensis TaxID=1286938 RepID=A0ABW1C347_9ACTN|nr:hypothetical protein [Nonomuraea harbinensis]
MIYAGRVDGESLAAAALLAALGRAAGILSELRHPFVRGRPFSYVVPPAGVRTGAAFMLPDGREVTFAVLVAASGNGFRVEGGVTVEDEALVELPARHVPEVRGALALLDEYAAEVGERAGALLDNLLDEIV